MRGPRLIQGTPGSERNTCAGKGGPSKRRVSASDKAYAKKTA